MRILTSLQSIYHRLHNRLGVWGVFIIALLSGVALSFAQAPYSLWFLIFPCFSVLYALYVSAQNKKQVFALGFLFALGYFVTGLNWIGNALLVEGNEFKWVWPLAVIALPSLLALFTGLFLTLGAMLFPHKKAISGFIGFCAALALNEWVRGYAFTGLPWNLYGYSWINVPPITQSVSVIGPYGLSLLTIIWGAVWGYVFIKNTQRPKLLLSVALGLFVICAVFGILRLERASDETHADIDIHIVQPNIAQAAKWRPEQLAANFEKHVRLSASSAKTAKRNVIIWPETAVPPAFIHSLAAKERITPLLRDKNTILLTGALVVMPDEDQRVVNYHNSLMLWDGLHAPEKLYDKSHLVPFGEYIPFQKYIPLTPVVSFTGFQRGNGAQTFDFEGFPTFTPLICYEIIFPHKIVNPNDPRPDYILNVTNDGWYGDSAGPYQHFTQARFRAIENGLPVVRSANTGISGMIDAYGRIVAQTKLLRDDVIKAPLPKGTRQTIYQKWGDWPFILIIISAALFLRRKQP